MFTAAQGCVAGAGAFPGWWVLVHGPNDMAGSGTDGCGQDPPNITATRISSMHQLCRIAMLTAPFAFVVCLTGCGAPQKKAEPTEPPVMGEGQGKPEVIPTEFPSGKATEVDLVEKARLARAQYQQALEALLAYYRKYGYFDRSNWAEKEILELRGITRYPYLGDAVAQNPRYQPKEDNAGADALYSQALTLYKEATGLGGLIGGKEKLQKALDLFRQVIERYPNSDKIDDAAFYAGEIYASDDFKEYTLALNSYQRCLKWNPNTELPVKFRMAVLYDYRLRDREKAMDLYKQVVEAGKNASNVRYAQNRIRQLTDRGSYEAPDAEPGVKP
jgi:TolA-binding protein